MHHVHFTPTSSKKKFLSIYPFSCPSIQLDGFFIRSSYCHDFCLAARRRGTAWLGGGVLWQYGFVCHATRYWNLGCSSCHGRLQSGTFLGAVPIWTWTDRKSHYSRYGLSPWRSRAYSRMASLWNSVVIQSLNGAWKFDRINGQTSRLV